jgi:beta-lactamase regulating signal transducer with metallopeptidase domain
MTELDLAVSAFLVNALWQGALIALVAWCAVKVLDGASAKGHYWIWAAALLLSVMAPALSLRGSDASRIIELPLVSADREPAGSPATVPRSIHWASGAYGIIVLFQLTKVALAWRRARALSRARRQEAPADWRAACASAQQYFGLGRIDIGISDAVTVPLTVGFWKPVILLPAEFDTTLIEGTLMHEMAHIARRDYAWNFAFQVLSAPLTILPGVVFMKRQLERAREMACDEMAAETASDHRVYARQLVGAAELLAGRWRTEAGLGVFDGNILEERVKRIMAGGVRATKGGAVAMAMAVTMLMTTAAASYTPLRIPSQAAVSGVITDVSGARIGQDTQVVLSGPSITSRTVVTDPVGEFRIGGLAPGTYSLEVRRRGFRLLRSSALRLEAGTELKLHGSLEIGRIRETINVIGN